VNPSADMPEHILVVEDDSDLRDTLSDALRMEGYDVVAVEHGEAALRYLQSGLKPCMILLDLMMPVMDGWTFRREMLKDDDLAAIPVIVMTAVQPARANAIPSDEVLYKPLEMGTVVAAVQTHCPDGAA